MQATVMSPGLQSFSPLGFFQSDQSVGEPPHPSIVEPFLTMLVLDDDI